MAGVWFDGRVPFRDVFLHGLVRDEKGQKMSKTKGNVIDPLEMCDEFGADAVRFALAVLSGTGRDLPFGDDARRGLARLRDEGLERGALRARRCSGEAAVADGPIDFAVPRHGRPLDPRPPRRRPPAK